MLLRIPDFMSVFSENNKQESTGAEASFDDVDARCLLNDNRLSVRVKAEETPLTYLRLRWNYRAGERRKTPVKILGDTWERAYGTLEWRSVVPERCMPWYCAVSDGSDTNPDCSGRLTEAFGVQVRPAAMCFWQYDGEGVTLWLDIRCGGKGVLLGGRELEAAKVVFGEYRDQSAFCALRSFCGEMCRDGLTAEHAVYGSNNWYYAYGKSSREEILTDAKLAASLCGETDNPPYMVIDDGWQPFSCSGPWDRGNERFPDMAALAAEMKAAGVRPGIWVRYLYDQSEEIPDFWRLPRDSRYLDPSVPEVIEFTEDITKRFLAWGYDLIKFDYTAFDIFGNWGSYRPTVFTDDGWAFADRGRTSAEITVNFYQAIRRAAGSAVLLACNTPGHLVAGIAELNRTGDDTSGTDWERTRKMGVNALAFRMPQNGIFYDCDADCVGITGKIPWELNRKWLSLLAESGTPLFVSCKPGICSEGELREIAYAFKQNRGRTDALIPVDWMENVCPAKWLLNGKPVEIDWHAEEGANTFSPLPTK